ncbi:MAG: 4-(cytidine 5'-diphospho)-2-C-methyl-D-erythritol kinase [Bacteroidetes bacterium]|nr:4-(cytidine 5'-diphospho)-2-C-methyl-D-erythritol kinase [Bacteroidota bacterium]
MILFPPAKVNLGLNILFKREDGYHEIETCMIPIPFTDILEITESDEFEFLQTGLAIPGNLNSNLCVKAFQLMKEKFAIPNVRIHLRKQIPMGAGLGGGSADAAYVLRGLNEMFELNVSTSELEILAAQLGSDCPFFIHNKAQIARGRGEVLSEIEINLIGKHLILLNPGIHVGTKEAYDGVQPRIPSNNIEDILSNSIEKWHNELVNQFEESILPKYPLIKELKDSLIDLGAVYASMSGSGSSVFGIFNEKPNEIPLELMKYLVFEGEF